MPRRWRRQAEEGAKKEESFEAELCKDKDAGEWFRLVAGEGDNCRDVIQCTSSVSKSKRQFFFCYLKKLVTSKQNKKTGCLNFSDL